MPISEDTRADAMKLVQRYPVSRSALLPLLHLVQSDEGYVSEDGIAFCAELLELTRAEVGAVATFYTMFKREPFGDYLLSVCTNPTCKIAGAGRIFDSYLETCGGEIDRDGSGVMVEHAECLGICDAAPVVQINYEMYGPVSHDEAMELLSKAKAGDPPPSNWSQEVPATFREVERELSGIEDGTDEYLIEAARLQVTDSEVPPQHRTGETDIPVTHPGGDPAGHGGRSFRETSGLGIPAGPGGQTADVPPEQVEVAEDVAAAGTGIQSDLAQQAVDEPVGASPAAQDQPQVDQEPGSSAEAAEAPATGTEEEPSTSTAGEGGTGDVEEPTSERDAPSEEDTDLATDQGEPVRREGDADTAAADDEEA